jgi:hypothetical protein
MELLPLRKPFNQMRSTEEWGQYLVIRTNETLLAMLAAGSSQYPPYSHIHHLQLHLPDKTLMPLGEEPEIWQALQAIAWRKIGEAERELRRLEPELAGLPFPAHLQ